MSKHKKHDPVIPKEYIIPFILITILFPLWGFANDITNPLVAAFQTVMEISAAKAALVQFAFYGGYATMAIPAALVVKKYSYKTGILIGLGLYATGAFLFWPAARFEIFAFFLIAYYILTFGLAFLETTANPYILSMGSENTSTRRLNFAQSFNPLGSLLGMIVATHFILALLHSDERDVAGNLIYPHLSAAQKAVIRAHDLVIIRDPYVILGLVVLVVFILIAVSNMPKNKSVVHTSTGEIFRRLFKLPAYRKYREGVIAQVFYVGAQIMCWTFIIQYGEHLGLTKAQGEEYNIVAMIVFVSGRFIGTYLMKYIEPGKLLFFFAIGGMITTTGAIFIQGMTGLYSLMATSLFMSIMFPTIYGISLRGMTDDDAKLGAAGLVMAIVGGALMPPLQGKIIDLGTVAFLPAVNASFILPFISFVVISVFGYRTFKIHHAKGLE
ncbi:MAG TPA: L-fucose:H+ symporter permease [Bacteroidetes bacterium]|nr:L-fucose:H+ symporter permease [Bacteroidota bacterium]